MAGKESTRCFSSRCNEVVKIACLSRIAILVACVLSDFLIPDHSPDDSVAKASEDLPRWLHAFTRWDAARFLGIAERGYDTEESYAFFPLLPLLMNVLASPIQMACQTNRLTALVLAGLSITNGCFVVSAWLLYRLGRELLLDEELAFRAVKLFCLTPANVFMSTLYTESPFSACVLAGLVLLRLDWKFFAALAFACGTGFRSNGLLNCGFFVHAALIRCLKEWDHNQKCHHHAKLVRSICFHALSCSILCALVASPYFLLQAYAAMRECNVPELPDWCTTRFPNIYSHVQSTYWQVGLFKYWQLKQLPNFLLAGPSLCLAMLGGALELRRFWETCRDSLSKDSASKDTMFRSVAESIKVALVHCPLLPHAIHWIFLAVFVLLFANVQIATRVLASACPISHCFLAVATSESNSTRARSAGKGITSYHPGTRVYRFLFFYICLWNVLGIVMHPNFLPWT
eukprot:TRINITY_DN6531_c1_g4_i1.p1 TRINITY_DN6531_c1_g4~~TRINITY_DN6531_c1_g4_i1.p1  ORF type:complete len:459 (-),score=44.56 TRINITY_DN6531_c1_g4_i1:103-1479(-)